MSVEKYYSNIAHEAERNEFLHVSLTDAIVIIQLVRLASQKKRGKVVLSWMLVIHLGNHKRYLF